MKQPRLQHFVVTVLLVALPAFSSQRGIAEAEQSSVPDVVTQGEITMSLTSTVGDPTRGEQIVLDRERGDCIVCHAMPLPNRQFHGTVGPALDGVGSRFSLGALRLRIVDAKALNPQSVMPAYHKVRGLSVVRAVLRKQPILTAQEIEDVVAYLATLKTELPPPETRNIARDSPISEPGPRTPPKLTPYSIEERRSGYTYLPTDLQQLQNDEFANPGMLWVERGQELWQRIEGNAQKSCTQCHGEASTSMRGVQSRFPCFDQHRKKLINLEQQINRCRHERMHASIYPYESDELLSLTTFIAYQSRGLSVEVQVDQTREPFFAAGRRFFMQRRGQLDLACTHCHDQLAGQRLRGEVISQGQLNGFPIYRQLWQTLGSAHRMFAWCNNAIRAEPLPLGSDAYVNLELYMNWRARGLPVESPAVRR